MVRLSFSIQFCAWWVCSSYTKATMVQALRHGVNRIVVAPPPVSPPSPAGGSFAPSQIPVCNLCSATGGGTTSSAGSSLPIAPGSSTTCDDVEITLETLEPYDPSCQLVLSTDLPGRCGCPTQAPSPAPIAYAPCHVCQNEGELVTKPYDTLNLNNTSLNPTIASSFYDCSIIDYFGSINAIEPGVCSQLHDDIGISNLCGCQTPQVGPSTCASAISLTLGQTVFSTIANVTTNITNFKNKPCTIDSPSAWFHTIGTGGPLTIDTQGYSNIIPKITVFTGETCNQLTCLGGNGIFESRYTFSSIANQNYFLVLGGFYGDVGALNLTLTDQTDPPTIAPSAYPTTPTIAPSPYPTSVPVPTETPTQYPTVASFPECNICNNSDQRVSLPFTQLGPSTGYACQDIEYYGLTGQIRPSVCSFLKALNFAEKCGCTAPTGNDICQNAITISPGQSLHGTTINATWDNERICPYDNYYASGVWYTFLGTGGPLKIDTCKASDTYSGLSVFSGSTCSSLSCVATNNGFCGLGSRVTVNSIRGMTYYALVHGDPGNFEVTLSQVTPPANDLCPRATPIAPGQTLLGTTTDATPDNLPSCRGDVNNTSTAGVWYKVSSTSADPTRFILSTCGRNTNMDTAISVFSGSCGNLACIVGNDNFCGRASRVVWEAPGTGTVTDYFILVHGPSNLWFSSDFELELEQELATPTVSPAPSYLFRNGPCHCEGNAPCICAAFASPTFKGDAGDGSNPRPYMAPVPAPIFEAATYPTPVRQPDFDASLPSSSPYIYSDPPLAYYTSNSETENFGYKKGQSLKGSKKNRNEKKGGKN